VHNSIQKYASTASILKPFEIKFLKKSIFREEKSTSTSKILFDVIPFSPLHHTISKTLSQVSEKVFLTLFGLSLAWQYT
jgi:hypothetical protein